jgi:F0F1-type ATP synthase membrane subunit b/b'
MLIRISLILAIVAGLAVGVLNFVTVKNKINTLQTNLADTTQKKEAAEASLKKTRSDLEKTVTELTQTKATLETTTAERDAAVAKADTQEKLANQLSSDLAKTKTERDAAQSDLAAYRATGFTAPQVLALGKTLKATQDDLDALRGENKVLGQKIASLNNELSFYRDKDYVVELPASLKGSIVVSDPKWDFVILNVGQDQGVLPRGELLVNRDGKLVAKVRVTSVQKNRSVANVIPGWKLGEVLEGDQVIPAHPAS